MADRPIKSDNYMSDFESLMWTLERDPRLSAGFANITILDQPGDLAHLQSRLLRAAAIFPQLRRRVESSIAHLAPPTWIDVPDFDISAHVATARLSAPGNRTQLCELAIEFCHRPYDTTRPLWDFLLVDGLDDGKGAVLQRMHHTITDGIGAVRMSEQFIDLARDAPDPAPIPLPESATGNNWMHSSVGDALTHNLRRQADAARRAATSTFGLIRHPSRIPPAFTTTGGFTQALVHEAAGVGGRRSPLWTERSLVWSLKLIRVPLDEIHSVAKNHGCTINDVFVAGAAGGAGAYHRARGVAVDELRMAMPVSHRSDRSAAGNAFDMARIIVPTGPDPSARLALVHDRLSAARGTRSLALVHQLAGVANLVPPPLLVRTALKQIATVDFTSSNVRGASFPLFMAGAHIESNHPIGPLFGTAFNLTTLSYDGSLDMGLHIDCGAVDDPTMLASCIEDAFDELRAI